MKATAACLAAIFSILAQPSIAAAAPRAQVAAEQKLAKTNKTAFTGQQNERDLWVVNEALRAGRVSPELNRELANYFAFSQTPLNGREANGLMAALGEKVRPQASTATSGNKLGGIAMYPGGIVEMKSKRYGLERGKVLGIQGSKVWIGVSRDGVATVKKVDLKTHAERFTQILSGAAPQ